MSRRLLSLALLFLLAPAPALAQDCPEIADLVGTWRWVQSQNGGEGTTFDPDDFGYDLRVEFKVDGTARALAGRVLAVGSFTLDCVPDTHTATLNLDLGDLKLEEPLGSILGAGVHLSLDPVGALRIQEPCVDCWRHEFSFDPAGLVPVSSLSVSAVKGQWQSPNR